MVKVVLTSGTSQQFTAGQVEVEVEATDLRQMVRALDEKFPGLGAEIDLHMSVALDGVILPDPLLEKVDDGSEVFILPKIGGG
ncbi:MAG: MoaD/ThiS family protein [Alphaproteobacteria bacterium]|jgi:molybdopterin converting factor small subunit|nr:MoaD/ThiS family protein [Alphaproteobacteria bacterium]MDP6563191.1 MoaD/ThiS family protein [Alphaproteobacteria bacterium]